MRITGLTMAFLLVLLGVRDAGAQESSWRGPGEGEAARPMEPEQLVVPVRIYRTFKVNAYSGSLVIDSVDVAYTPRVRSLNVVVGGSAFRVTGDGSVSFAFHERTRWGVITPRVSDASVTVELPANVRRFKIRVAGTTVWEFAGGRGRAHCDPVAEISLTDGRKSWVFTPDNGRLECTVPRGPRPA